MTTSTTIIATEHVRKLLLWDATAHATVRGPTGVRQWCNFHKVQKTHCYEFLNGVRTIPPNDVLEALGLEWVIRRKPVNGKKAVRRVRPPKRKKAPAVGQQRTRSDRRLRSDLRAHHSATGGLRDRTREDEGREVLHQARTDDNRLE